MRSSSASRRLDRRSVRWFAFCGVALIATMAVAPQALARGAGRYAQRNLVSDQAGRAELLDPSLVNAWGLAFGPMTPAWVANNGTDNSTLYSGGIGGAAAVKVPLTVSIAEGAPTGMVYNGTPGFPVDSGASSGPATFLFSSESGRITGWNISVSPTQAPVVKTVPSAIFKGLAIANAAGGERIYATDFHNGRVDVWNSAFKRIHRPGAFRDPKIPSRFAPFGIQAIGGKLIVTYAKQDRDAEDDVPGAGHGFVDVYDTSGKLLRRFARRGPLDSPWGVARAPTGFGGASGALLIGNFGDGRINAFDPRSGRFLGPLRRRNGARLAIEGLWALQFGNGVIGGPKTLLFTAGPAGESHGLFGELTAAPAPTGY
jgi:uncharacterized protein (TIGR03118 family)